MDTVLEIDPARLFRPAFTVDAFMALTDLCYEAARAAAGARETFEITLTGPPTARSWPAWFQGREVRYTLDLAEACEALAARGVLPPDPTDGGRRSFALAIGDPCPCGYGTLRGLHPGVVRCLRCGESWPTNSEAPPSLSALLRLASTWPAVVTAEALAWEVAARLAPWGFRQPARVVWRMVDAATWQIAELRALNHVLDLALLDPRAQARFDHERRLDLVPEAKLLDTAAWAFGKQALGVRQAGIHRAAAIAWDVAGGMPASPFAPLVALWNTGMALDAITPDAIVLVCPEEGVLAGGVADRGAKAMAEEVARG